MPKLSVSRVFTNGDPLLVTLVPLSGICSKVCVTLGIWLVFVFLSGQKWILRYPLMPLLM